MSLINSSPVIMIMRTISILLVFMVNSLHGQVVSVEYLNDSISREVNEGDASVFHICFSVVDGRPGQDFNVSLVSAESSTAIEGSDYILSGNPLLISPTANSGCIEVAIIDDNISENDDMVSFTAVSSDPVRLRITEGGSLNLTIINDDFPVIEFNNSKYIISEGRSSIEICLRVNPDGARIGPDHLPLEIELESIDKTAQGGGVDFTLSSRPISFSDTTQTISCENRLTIFGDDFVEITESFTMYFNHQPIGGSDEVDVVIYDFDVCPTIQQGLICKDLLVLSVCNMIQSMNNGFRVPRYCDSLTEDYSNIGYYPGSDS